MGALATLISRAITEGLVSAGGTLGHLPVLPGVSVSGAAAPPSTVAPIPPTSSLPPARGELYSSRGSFRGWVFVFVGVTNRRAPVSTTHSGEGVTLPGGRLAHGKGEVGRWVSAGRGKRRGSGGQSQFGSDGGQLSIVAQNWWSSQS